MLCDSEPGFHGTHLSASIWERPTGITKAATRRPYVAQRNRGERLNMCSDRLPCRVQYEVIVVAHQAISEKLGIEGRQRLGDNV